MRKTLSIAIALLLAASVAAAADQIYRWKDSSGIWNYSDQPRPGAELVKSTHRAIGTAPVAGDTAPASNAPPAPGQLPVSDDVAKQVRQEAADIKSEQCKKAEENYKKAIQSRRIYKLDEAGNKVYLNNAEIDTARLQARSDRDLACGS